MDGLSKDGMTTYDTSEFTVGGKGVHVPILMLIDLQECRKDLEVVDRGGHWIDYADSVMRVVAHQVVSYQPDKVTLSLAERSPFIEAKYVELSRACTAGEATNLASSMTDLMRASGFLIPETETAPAENPGTGTSTLSPSDSPVEGFAEEILSS